MTTVDKTLKTLFWVIASAASTAAVSYVTDNPALFNPFVVGFANILAVAVKNYLDPKVENI